METFILKLAVAVIPLILLITITVASRHFAPSAHQPLSWHRSRRQILCALATGIMLR
jgi:hypothetical protein